MHSFMADSIEKQNIRIGKFVASNNDVIINFYYTPTVLTTNSLIFNQDRMKQWWEIGDKGIFLKELIEYTSPSNSYNIREKALEYIGYLNLWNRVSLLNLIDASQHHYWRFRDFSRNILKGLLKDENYREQFLLLEQDLGTDSLNFLKRMLNEK